MDKSGQGRHQELESNKTYQLESHLNWLREGALLLFSIALWLFVLTAFITVTFTIFEIEAYYIQLVRTILSITREELMTIVWGIGFFAVIFIVYLSITYANGPFSHPNKRNEGDRND